MKHRRVIFIDARHTAAEESRDRMLAILASIAGHENIIACLAGFTSLIQSPLGSNRGALLSGLGHVKCQIIGLMTPAECDELVKNHLKQRSINKKGGGQQRESFTIYFPLP